MCCPECGEQAVRQPPSDLVPWQAHGIDRPGWSHRDGSSLCPVIGQSGGYQPAQPQPRRGDPGTQSASPDPPASMRAATRTGRAASPARVPAPERPAGTAGVLGRQYMTRVIATLGQLHRQAAAEPQPEPEAGA